MGEFQEIYNQGTTGEDLGQKDICKGEIIMWVKVCNQEAGA